MKDFIVSNCKFPRQKHVFFMLSMVGFLCLSNPLFAQVHKDTVPPDLKVAGPDTSYIEVTKNPMHPVPVPKVISAYDSVDGQLQGSVIIDSAKVQTNILGLYKVSYTVSDLSNNTAIVYRYVSVIDTLAPVLKLIGANPDYVEVYNSYNEQGVTASDNYYTAAKLYPLIKINSNVDSSTVGTYTVTYDITDPSGNKATTVVRTVIVLDSLKPNVTLNGPQSDSIEVNTKYVDKGITSTDNYNNSAEIIVTFGGTFYSAFPTGIATTLGFYTIIYTATDKSGNKSHITRNILVTDHTPPVISLQGDAAISVCEGDVYVDAGYSVSDNYDKNSGITINVQGSFVVNGTTSPGLYTLRYKAEDLSHNIGYSNYRYIQVKPTSDFSCKSNTTIDTVICKGTCATLTARKSGTGYKWSSGATSSSITYCPKQDTAITVTISLSGGGTYSYLYNLIVSKNTCVWPGDADGDFKADKNDVLAIGVAYGDSGTKRSGATTDWKGQESYDWKSSFKSGVNHKNTDCNGDGTVDSTDMAAVSKNYGLSHSKTNGANGSSNDPPLSIAFSSDSAHVGDTVSATIQLGTATNPVKNAYGLTFSITYTSKYVKPIKSKGDFSNCWLGTPGKDMITFIYNDTANGVLDIALTRIDHKNISSGYGDLGKLSIVMQDNVGGKTWIDRKIYFKASDARVISNNETEIPIYTRTDSVKIYQSGINDPLLPGYHISLFPNPVAGNLYMNSGDLKITDIMIIDNTGKTVYGQTFGKSGQIEIPTGMLNAGVYTIMVHSNKGNVVNRFVKN